MNFPNHEPNPDPLSDVPLGLRRAIERVGGEVGAQEIEHPQVPLQLIEYLEAVHPVALPGVRAGLAEIQREAGRQDVVQHLRAIHNSQE